MRKKELVRILDQQLQIAKVNLSSEHMAYEVNQFFDLPSNASTVQLSVELVTLLASICNIKQPDPVRLQSFVIKNAFGEYVTILKSLPRLKRKRDVWVDVFGANCTVPGFYLTGERWCKQ